MELKFVENPDVHMAYNIGLNYENRITWNAVGAKEFIIIQIAGQNNINLSSKKETLKKAIEDKLEDLMKRREVLLQMDSEPWYLRMSDVMNISVNTTPSTIAVFGCQVDENSGDLTLSIPPDNAPAYEYELSLTTTVRYSVTQQYEKRRFHRKRPVPCYQVKIKYGGELESYQAGLYYQIKDETKYRFPVTALMIENGFWIWGLPEIRAKERSGFIVEKEV